LTYLKPVLFALAEKPIFPFPVDPDPHIQLA
jgi:hypothetical protein